MNVQKNKVLYLFKQYVYYITEGINLTFKRQISVKIVTSVMVVPCTALARPRYCLGTPLVLPRYLASVAQYNR
jgi:hypothetical protein